MTVTIPDGINSAGMGSLFVTEAVEDPTAPSVAEFGDPAGFAIHCDLEGWNVTGDQPKVQKPRYCLPATQEKFGRVQYSSDPLVVVYNPQEPDSADYQAYLRLVTGQSFWVADRRGKPSRSPLEVGDVADLWRITIGLRIPMPITDEDGEDLRVQIFISVQDRRENSVFVA